MNWGRKAGWVYSCEKSRWGKGRTDWPAHSTPLIVKSNREKQKKKKNASVKPERKTAFKVKRESPRQLRRGATGTTWDRAYAIKQTARRSKI